NAAARRYAFCLRTGSVQPGLNWNSDRRTAPARVIAVRPPCPDPEDDEYVWIDGYWYPADGHYYWHRGYWTRPPYVGALWVVPHYEEGHYYGDYWKGPHGRFAHDHHWDHDRDRDHGRWHEDNGKHKGWYKKDREDQDRD